MLVHAFFHLKNPRVAIAQKRTKAAQFFVSAKTNTHKKQTNKSQLFTARSKDLLLIVTERGHVRVYKQTDNGGAIRNKHTHAVSKKGPILQQLTQIRVVWKRTDFTFGSL